MSKRFSHLTRRAQLLLIGVALVVLAAGTGSAVYWHEAATRTVSEADAPTTTTTASDNTPGTASAASQQPAKPYVLRPAPSFTLTGVTFLSAPQLLGDLHFFANFNSLFSGPVPASNIAYYQIGTDQANRRIINASVTDDCGSPAGPCIYNFITLELSTSNYVVLAQPSTLTSDEITELDQTLNSSVTINPTLHVPSLEFPTTLSVPSAATPGATAQLANNDRSVIFTPNGLDAALGKPITLFGSTSSQQVYEVGISSKSDRILPTWYATIHNMFTEEYYLTDPLYNTADFVSMTQPLAITWKSGQNNSSAYGDEGVLYGCAYVPSYVALPPSFDASSLTAIGSGPKGQTIYALPDNSPVLTDDYNVYKSYGSSSLGAPANATLTQFQADHIVIVAQNSAKEWVVYTRNDAYQFGGCGEPVIYLYPTQPTSVDVRVGARVVKSSPLYTASTGWQHVLARPSGQLTYQGATYPSLYWEGYGEGPYPLITSGTVVPTFLAPNIIRQQLSAQGLHRNEIDDFLTFWGNKLPTAPYTRLTWLNTAQMEQLAPLHVTPHPDTLIRVFLDFQGLDQPAALPPQHFTAPARSGFTVVEWGGLLHGGIK